MHQPNQADYMAETIAKIMKKYRLTGKVLLINAEQSNQDNEGVGFANKANTIPNQDNDVLYPSASLQKAMTAAMMIQIINESKTSTNPISEYTTIERWFPDLNKGAAITISQLLTHTSGIVDLKSERDPGFIMTEDQAVQATVSRINASKLSLTHFYYDNDNYILLAGIIRHETQMSYADNLTQRIINPLNLSHTFMWHDVSPQTHKLAVSYRSIGPWQYRKPRLANPQLMSYIVGAGNLYTTPDDYLKFQRGLHNNQILNVADYTQLTHQPDQPKNGYSGGMYHRHRGKLKKVYGYLRGTNYRNWVQLSGDSQYGIILFSNQSRSAATVKHAAYDILQLFSDKFDAK
ncbi:class A beta-lactamase-related serine hydrolase [Weissella viridescens]|uniref:Class A beta-lactamase-related serine hydrolase n=1 Tax=Weissella viridescens TaxID=1629 RepID=A0A3P2RAV8_WEIVI|nr:serine hydrolase domain-containing protein [Weissella viridescens]RRG17644.1 class A beta-lactamase-related serine hydrolase [Weissella viridescens]